MIRPVIDAWLSLCRWIGRLLRPKPPQTRLTLDRRDYRNGLLISESMFGRGTDYELVANADLVVNTAGMVLKNRPGPIGFGGEPAVTLAMELPNPERRGGESQYKPSVVQKMPPRNPDAVRRRRRA